MAPAPQPRVLEDPRTRDRPRSRAATRAPATRSEPDWRSYGAVDGRRARGASDGGAGFRAIGAGGRRRGVSSSRGHPPGGRHHHPADDVVDANRRLVAPRRASEGTASRSDEPQVIARVAASLGARAERAGAASLVPPFPRVVDPRVCTTAAFRSPGWTRRLFLSANTHVRRARREADARGTEERWCTRATSSVRSRAR